MVTVFEILKWFFFLFSVLIWLFFLRGTYIFSDSTFTLLWELLLPWYLLLTGIIIGYIIWNFLIIKNDIKWENEINKVYIKSLIIWLIIWIFLSAAFIFKIFF